MKFCTLSSGSSGNCHYVATEQYAVLVDAGLSGKAIQGHFDLIQENIQNVKGILITHEHSDHTKGAGILSRRFKIPIYANEKTWEAMEKDLGKIAPEHIKIFKTGDTLELEDLKIRSYGISHDAKEPVGYVFENGNRKISVLTDTGIATREIQEQIRDSDLMVLESNHDVKMLEVGPYPYYLKRRIKSEFGHLSNEDCGNLLCELLGEKRQIVLLGHLSKENNFPELAYQTVMNILSEKRRDCFSLLQLELTHRDKPTQLYRL